jgi:hypothetical protein
MLLVWITIEPGFEMFCRFSLDAGYACGDQSIFPWEVRLCLMCVCVVCVCVCVCVFVCVCVC